MWFDPELEEFVPATPSRHIWHEVIILLVILALVAMILGAIDG